MMVRALARRAPWMTLHANATAAEYRDSAAGADIGGVERSADTGHHAAANETSLGRRNVATDRNGLASRDDGVSAKSAHSKSGRQLQPVGGLHPRLGVEAGTAKAGLANFTEPAVATGGAPSKNDEIPNGRMFDAGADGLDNACPFVTKEVGKVIADRAIHVHAVGVANPTGLDTDEDLARPGVIDDDVFEQGLATGGADDYSLGSYRHETASLD